VAMSYGKPIVASNLGAIPEIVEHNTTGFLAETNSVTDFVDKIQHIYEDDQLALKMGQAGRQRVKDRFNMEIFYNQLVGIYQNAIDNPAID
ncbi:glycosyltransferase family 4 protein, partial [bacterium]|nr:glycosyltransferase family 4 protein [bacterium]